MPHAIAKDGVRLYLEECGAGKAVIFIHEFAGDYASYEPQMRNLARQFRCVSFNARGFPPSDVPADQAAYSQLAFCADVLAVMDYLSIEAAHLVGVSMGAFTALYTALDHPQRVSSLVVAGCGFAADPKSRDQVVRDIEAAAAKIEAEGMGTFAETYAHGPARIQFKLKDPRGWNELKAQLSQHSASGSAMTLRGVQRDRPSLYSLGDRLAQLYVPVLIVAGDEDEPCLEASLFLKRTLPNAGLSILPHAGHTVNLEEPAAFNRLCTDFFDAVDRGVRLERHLKAVPNPAYSVGTFRKIGAPVRQCPQNGVVTRRLSLEWPSLISRHGEICRLQSAYRSLSTMDRLDAVAFEEVVAVADRHDETGDAQAVRHPRRVEAKQAPSRRGRTTGPDGAGGLKPAMPVMRLYGKAEPGTDFVTGHQRGHDVGAAEAALLCDGQSDWNGGRAVVNASSQIGILAIQHFRQSSVKEHCSHRSCRAAEPYEGSGAGSLDKLYVAFELRLPFATHEIDGGDHDSHSVEHEHPGPTPAGFRDVLKGQACGKTGETARRLYLGHRSRPERSDRAGNLRSNSRHPSR